MVTSERPKVETVEEGAPEWMCTFADMMSLLLTFFILLLSFSTLDIIKYKNALGSIKDAFGVKELVTGKEVVKKEQPLIAPGKGKFTEEYQREDTVKKLKEVMDWKRKSTLGRIKGVLWCVLQVMLCLMLDQLNSKKRHFQY